MATHQTELPGNPVQIYKFKDRKRELDKNAIHKILDEAHDLPLAIVSVNGNKRTGKSFLLNFFLRFLSTENEKNWFIDATNKLNGFAWRGGSSRQTVGIWMWSKPFILNTEDGKIAVFLMDTQGSFDQQTTFTECTLMFCISVWLSSIFIFNIQGQLDEDKLQFLEYFTDFATRFSAEDIEYPGKLFQNFIFLMRDWPWPHDHAYGLHDQNSPEMRNFMKEIIIGGKDFSAEALATRQQILDYFNQVSCFLLPNPGRRIAQNIDGNIAAMNTEFAQHLQRFVSTVLGKENIKPKMIYGEQITGGKLKDIVDKWADVIHNQEFPEPKTLSEATAEAHLEMASRRAEKQYCAKILELAKGGIEDHLFESKNVEIMKGVMKTFKRTAMNFKKYEERYQYTKKLEKRINKAFVIYSQMNEVSRRETQYKECFEQAKCDRANIKRKLERQQTLFDQHQLETKQQKEISEGEKEIREKELAQMKTNLERFQLHEEKTNKTVDELRKKLKMQKKNLQRLKTEGREIFTPIAAAIGGVADEILNSIIKITSSLSKSSPKDDLKDANDDDSEESQNEDGDNDGTSNTEDGRNSGAEASQTIAAAVQAGIGAVVAGGTPGAVVLAGLGQLVQSAAAQSQAKHDDDNEPDVD